MAEKFWLKVFNDLKARKVEDIILLCGDGLKGLPEAVESSYPKTDVQLCVVHQIRNATKFVPYQDRKKFCADMRPIYTSPTIDAAELALLELEETWGKKYPMSVASWKANWVSAYRVLQVSGGDAKDHLHYQHDRGAKMLNCEKTPPIGRCSRTMRQ